MKNDPYRVAHLIAGFIRNTLNDEERDELDEWVVASNENMQLFGELTDDNNTAQNLAQIENIDQQTELKILLSRPYADELVAAPAKRHWLYASFAFAALLICLLFIYRHTSTSQIKTDRFAKIAAPDMLPAAGKPTLTIEGGEVIDLASVQKGLLKKTGQSLVTKTTDNALSYDDAVTTNGEIVFHILSVPAGGQFSVSLPDGTDVWLNAGSSLRYPDHFSDSERRVELNGEGYFEVSKNLQPFIVKTKSNNEIHVLGTHFNVKAYKDENTEAITLLEGIVEVTTAEKKIKLLSNEQVIISQHSLAIQKSVDGESVVAWKKGLFRFTDAPIEDIMKQVQHWYNVEVIFETVTTHHFNATISRDKPVYQLLHYLELTGQVHFKIENNKIIVMK